METRICKDCGCELPIEEFRMTCHNTRCSVCNTCSEAKRWKQEERIAWNVKTEKRKCSRMRASFACMILLRVN